MELFPKIDETETINNVKRWLKNVFPQLVLQAGMTSVDIKSPTISDMPSGTPYGNSNEQKYLHMLECQDEVKNVIRALNGYSEISRIILRNLYIYEYPDWRVANSLNYGLTRYKELKNKALLEFSNAMEAYNYHLTVYEKATN